MNTKFPKVPTLAEVADLQSRTVDLGKQITAEINEMAVEITTLAYSTPDDDRAKTEAIAKIAALGVLMCEAWIELQQLAVAHSLTKMMEDELNKNGAPIEVKADSETN